MKEIFTEELNKIKEIKQEQFEILYNIAQTLNSISYEDALIEKTLDLIIKAVNAERGLFVKHDKNEFSIIAARNIQKENIIDISAFSSGILKQVVSLRKPILYHDVQNNPDISKFQSIQLQQIKSVIGVPVSYNDEVWGIILVDSRGNRKGFTNDNLLFLDFVSNMVSMSLNKVLEYERLQNENRLLINQIESTKQIPDIIGESSSMKSIANILHKVAKTDATVLILGESGTGKDLIARAIHKLSSRKDNPFIAQFCGSIPDTLLESELFGFKKGAFTGAASDKKGLFEVADKGTFFLDEIADISMALQAKLLRVLENWEIIRLGDTNVKKIDVRIIAATNKELLQLAREGKFREDLFYRLNVFPIVIPPLRERRGDISLLAMHFIKKYGGKDIRINTEALKKLEKYHWPGNVRQLENILKRALILCESNVLLPEHIVLEEDNPVYDFNGTLEEFEILILKKRLKDYDGNRTMAAKSLGVSVRWIQLKLKEFPDDKQ